MFAYTLLAYINTLCALAALLAPWILFEDNVLFPDGCNIYSGDSFSLFNSMCGGEVSVSKTWKKVQLFSIITVLLCVLVYLMTWYSSSCEKEFLWKFIAFVNFSVFVTSAISWGTYIHAIENDPRKTLYGENVNTMYVGFILEVIVFVQAFLSIILNVRNHYVYQPVEGEFGTRITKEEPTTETQEQTGV